MYDLSIMRTLKGVYIVHISDEMVNFYRRFVDLSIHLSC